MKRIVILDCPEIECPPVLRIVFQELSTGFSRRGFPVTVCTRISELTSNDIVFMGDFFHCEDPEGLLYAQAPDAIYIGWYWHTIRITRLPNFIYTHENALVHDDRVKQMTGRVRCPLPLRASEDPLLVGTFPRTNLYDYCSIGPWAYSRDLRPTKFNGYVHDNYGVENFLDYPSRKRIYLASKLALAFQSGWNIEYQHVSQRIYEALAYGCVTFSNSKPASDQTDGIVVHVTSKEDLEAKMEYYLQHPEEAEAKRQKGYAFVRSYGTNAFTVDLLLHTILTTYLSQSQARQDEFVFRVCPTLKGTFFDIGSQHPININNTYALEQVGWSGYLFDINPSVQALTTQTRSSPFFLADMTTFDWTAFLTAHGLLGKRIDYLSFDIDEASLVSLRRFPFDKVSFHICTIEHDSYRFGEAVATEMRSILTSHGYSLVCKDVSNGGNPYEDWYVHTDLLPSLQGITFDRLDWSDILRSIRSNFPQTLAASQLRS